MNTFNYNDVSRQEKLDVLLSEIVLGQLEAGHFEVVDAVNQFIIHLPHFVMDRTNRACTLVSTMASRISEEEVDDLLAQRLPIITIGQSATFMEICLRWIGGCMGERLVANAQNLEYAKQYCNLGLIVIELAQVLELPKAMMKALEAAHMNAVAYKLDIEEALSKEQKS